MIIDPVEQQQVKNSTVIF